MIIVDSNVLIDILRGRNGINQILKKYPNEKYAISTITIEELYAGLGFTKEKLSSNSYSLILKKHEELIQQFLQLTINTEILMSAGLYRGLCLSKGNTIDSPDAIIVATAQFYKMERIITRNPDHFKYTNIPIETYSN
jgi:predicted nucleic acid-binding protein